MNASPPVAWDAESVRAELLRIAVDQLGWTGLPEGDLADRLDSVDRLALVVAIEDRFLVAFEPEDDASARTVDDVVRVVLARLSG